MIFPERATFLRSWISRVLFSVLQILFENFYSLVLVEYSLLEYILLQKQKIVL